MPEGPDGKTIIIVKKSGGHGGHHGGAWKVAYADFVTSMMALFMVLWLVNSASVPTRERIAAYFRKPGVFEKGSGTPLELGGGGILPETFAPPDSANSEVIYGKKIYRVQAEGGLKAAGSLSGEDVIDRQVALGPGKGEGPGTKDKEEQAVETVKVREATKAAEQVASQIKAEVSQQAAKISALLGQVEVKVDSRGLHLEIMDTDKASMFERGSAVIHPAARQQLEKIALLLAKLPNPVDIEGHTDAVPYRSGTDGQYDNWNLSVDRANAARKALREAGLTKEQVARVVGYAAQRPRLPKDPFHASNRRISISMRFSEQAARTLQEVNVVETHTAPPGAKSAAAQPPAGQPPAVQPAASQPPRGLALDIHTSLPEPATVEAQPAEEPDRPIWLEKDKIFGKDNPFIK